MHNKEDEYEAAAAATTDMDHNAIDTTSLKNVLVRLPIFLLSKFVHMMVIEEAMHILPLSAKYHAEAAGIFLFSIFCPRFRFLSGSQFW